MLSLEMMNQQLFLSLNATSETQSAFTNFALFCATDLLYLSILFSVFYWFKGSDNQKALIIKIVLTNALASALVFLIGKIDPTSRPFVVGIGHTLISYPDTPSFPSGHTTAFSVFFSSFYLAKKYLIALFLGVAGLLTAWARVYIGVHFPVDILGGLLLGIACSQFMMLIWQKYGEDIATSMLAYYQILIKKILPNSE